MAILVHFGLFDLVEPVQSMRTDFTLAKSMLAEPVLPKPMLANSVLVVSVLA